MASILDLKVGDQVKVIAKSTGRFGFPENDKGDVQLAVQFEISPNDPDYQGQYITWYQRLVDEKNFEFAWKGLRACGVTSNDLEDLRGIDANEVELVIEAREWDGKKKVEVRFVNPLGGPGLKIEKPASASRLRALSAMGKAAAQKHKPLAAAPPAPVAAPRFTVPTQPSDPDPEASASFPATRDDDIPF